MKPYDENKLSVGKDGKHRDSVTTECASSAIESTRKVRYGPLAGSSMSSSCLLDFFLTENLQKIKSFLSCLGTFW